jgi:hypothetical protein
MAATGMQLAGKTASIFGYGPPSTASMTSSAPGSPRDSRFETGISASRAEAELYREATARLAERGFPSTAGPPGVIARPHVTPPG